MFKTSIIALTATSFAVLVAPRVAEACGCFAPPDPTVPVVQAGERLVFAHEDGEVVAHIQIQYEGEASEFGWLLPVPAVPDWSLGTEELFNQIIQQTQPRYRLNQVFPDQCGGGLVLTGGAGRNGFEFDDSAGAPEAGDPNSPLVKEGSLGPFGFAALRADDEKAMFEWLKNNNYFVPAGTEDVVGPYIRPGAYFLAVKLESGEDAGDIQPIVLRYKSDYPMIPIILTSVAANPDMGIQVWVLGEDRAIPRNYRHTVLNDEKIDWFNAGANYNDVVIAATNEAPEGQSFVTEYAGSTDVMRNLLADDERFGERSDFNDRSNFIDYVEGLVLEGFNFDSALIERLESAISMPAHLVEQGLSPEFFFPSMRFYLEDFAIEDPQGYAAYVESVDFDPVALTTAIWERIVIPAREANALFDRHPMMTRMYTTLSPDEMTRDPVFAFNPDLPEVSRTREATYVVDCDGSGGMLTLPDGRTLRVENPTEFIDQDGAQVPFSRRIEVLAEEGAPEVVVDNRASITPSYDESSGCTATQASDLGLLGLLSAIALTFARRRRRA